MSNDMNSVKNFIASHNKFAITSHVNLEGDSLGSQLSFAKLLKILKKEFVIYDDAPPPKLFDFFEMAGDVKFYPNVIKNDFDASVVLDCPTIERTGRAADVIKKAPILNIDHHISNNNFGEVNLVDPHISSCGEMVYQLFKLFNAPIDKETALYLYVAIMTDTGSFRYDNTSSETHRIAGELLSLGLKPSYAAQMLFETKPLKKLLLLGKAIATLKLYFNGRVSVMSADKKMLKKFDSGIDGTEEFINFARSIDGIDVAIFIREDIKRNLSFVSFRSKGKVDVNELAKIFGGGGHFNASGCTIKGDFSKVKKILLKEVKNFLKNR